MEWVYLILSGMWMSPSDVMNRTFRNARRNVYCLHSFILGRWFYSIVFI